MARSVAVVVTDDLDGSPDAETVTFGYEGATYEIDLSEPNRIKLEEAVAPFIDAARRITRSRARSGAGRPPGSGRPLAPKSDRAAVRAWAKENGLKVSERGRISAQILEQYEAAQ